MGDIDYIYTQQGWLYLAVVIDLFSHKVVGWSMDDKIKKALVNDALSLAIQMWNPPKGLEVSTVRMGTKICFKSMALFKA